SIVSDPSGPYGGVNPPPNSGATFNPPIAGGLPSPPAVSLIINREGSNWKDDNNHVWDALIPWALTRNDIAFIDPTTLTVTTYAARKPPQHRRGDAGTPAERTSERGGPPRPERPPLRRHRAQPAAARAHREHRPPHPGPHPGPAGVQNNPAAALKPAVPAL